MSDPNLSPLPTDLATLFQTAAHAETADRALIARVQEGVSQRLALRDGGDHGGDDPARAPHAPTTTGVVSKAAAAKLGAALAVAGLAIGGGAGYLAGAKSAAPTPSASVVSVAPTVSIAPSSSVDSAPASATASAPPVVSVGVLTTASAAPVVVRGDLRRERELVDAAGAALRAGHADQALVEAERHAQRFPQGQLAEEREVLAVRALVALARDSEARTRADRARKQFPTLGRTLDAALGAGREK